MMTGKCCYIALLYLLIAGCSNRGPGKDVGNRVITDMLGRKVEVPDQVNRIVGLRAGALRLLVYMDAHALVAGIEENEKDLNRPYMQAYPELAGLPVIGPFMGGDAELIVNARPDIIFITYTTTGNADALQKKTGIPVVALICNEIGTSRDTLFASLQLIGKILHKEQRADSLIGYITQSIEDLNTRTCHINDTAKPLVYVGGVAYSGAHGINSTQVYYPPFTFVNARNAAAGIDKRLVSQVKGTYIDKEQLLLWDPDILFFDESGLDVIRHDLSGNSPLKKSLTAIRNNLVYAVLPYNNYATNYELVLANAWYAGKVLYPSAFEDTDITAKTAEILETFLGKNIVHQVMSSSVGFSNLPVNEW